MKKLKAFLFLCLTPAAFLQADTFSGEELKRTIYSNYRENYLITPADADSLGKIFSEGMVYGRIRSNTFYYRWNNELDDKGTHLVSGIGGSLIYKTAPYANLDFTGGLYYTYSMFNPSNSPFDAYKSGKDTFSRFDYANTGNQGLGVVGQAYLRYRGLPKTNLMIGRQIVESFYTKSNDSKMIPNTFDGILMDTRIIEDTRIKVGYLAKQKLRDHSQNHSVLMYGDDNSTASQHPEWSQNDDSAMHKGLSYTRLKEAGVNTDMGLFIADIQHRPLEGLRVNASAYSVPTLVSSGMLEVNYRLISGSDFVITPGVRYIHQFDNGAGVIGGANLNGDLAGQSGSTGGYKQADSADGDMIGVRLVTQYQNYKLNIAYTHIFDEADLIAPWRGFPTSGYTRSMARYNWRANMSSYRVQLERNFGQAGIYADTYMQASVMHTDADESKGQDDETYYYIGFVQNIPSLVDMSWRLRLGYNDTDGVDPSGNEYDSLDSRFELNFLF